MDEIFEKLKNGVALTHEEAATAAAHFYPKLHAPPDKELIDNVCTGLLPSRFEVPQAMQFLTDLSGLTEHELTAVFEKYDILSGRMPDDANTVDISHIKGANSGKAYLIGGGLAMPQEKRSDGDQIKEIIEANPDFKIYVLQSAAVTNARWQQTIIK